MVGTYKIILKEKKKYGISLQDIFSRYYMIANKSEASRQIILILISNQTFILNNYDCNKWSLFTDHLKAQNNFFLSDSKTKKLHILKKKKNFLNIPIFLHFNWHACNHISINPNPNPNPQRSRSSNFKFQKRRHCKRRI